MLNIIVCVKAVPDPKEACNIKIDPDTKTLMRCEVPFVINPLDKNAMEAAIQLKEQGDAHITVLSMGPPDAGNIVKECLALGADQGYLLSDAAFGGARRDEEKSRAKERIYSFRDRHHRWDPKNQRPELWSLYNARINKGESIRVFPLSNWTELDIWQYIYLESIPIVALYFAKERAVVERDGALIMVDDDRMPLEPGERPQMRMVRFRTLGCYPLTGAVESDATSLPDIIQEMLLTRSSERQGRIIDHDQAGSMEEKKRAGYF